MCYIYLHFSPDKNASASYISLCSDIHPFFTFFYSLVPKQMEVQGIPVCRIKSHQAQAKMFKIKYILSRSFKN